MGEGRQGGALGTDGRVQPRVSVVEDTDRREGDGRYQDAEGQGQRHLPPARLFPHGGVVLPAAHDPQAQHTEDHADTQQPHRAPGTEAPGDGEDEAQDGQEDQGQRGVATQTCRHGVVAGRGGVRHTFMTPDELLQSRPVEQWVALVGHQQRHRVVAQAEILPAPEGEGQGIDVERDGVIIVSFHTPAGHGDEPVFHRGLDSTAEGIGCIEVQDAAFPPVEVDEDDLVHDTQLDQHPAFVLDVSEGGVPGWFNPPHRSVRQQGPGIGGRVVEGNTTVGDIQGDVGQWLFRRGEDQFARGDQAGGVDAGDLGVGHHRGIGQGAHHGRADDHGDGFSTIGGDQQGLQHGLWGCRVRQLPHRCLVEVLQRDVVDERPGVRVVRDEETVVTVPGAVDHEIRCRCLDGVGHVAVGSSLNFSAGMMRR